MNHPTMSWSIALGSWQNCLALLNQEYLSDEDTNEILLNFKKALQSGEETLKLNPNDDEVETFVKSLRFYCNGLDNLETLDNNQALLLCLRSQAMAKGYWQKCIKSLKDDLDLNKSEQLFLKTLDSAQKHLDNYPDDEDIVSFVEFWDCSCDGLDGIAPVTASIKKQLQGVQRVVAIDDQFKALMWYMRGFLTFVAAKNMKVKVDCVELIRERSIPAFQEALHLRQGYTAAQEQLSNCQDIDVKNKAIEHYNLGVALSQQDKLYEANLEYEAALEINPDFFEARDNLAINHANLGILLEKQGRLDEAIGEAKTAIQLGFERANELLARLEFKRQSQKPTGRDSSSPTSSEPKKKGFIDRLFGN
jgi:tetratricopeptide (TPR) repeat protein